MWVPNLIIIDWELLEKFTNTYYITALWKNGKNMTIGVSIVQFVIKVQMIVTIYRVQDYEVLIVNPRRLPKIQDGRH